MLRVSHGLGTSSCIFSWNTVMGRWHWISRKKGDWKSRHIAYNTLGTQGFASSKRLKHMLPSAGLHPFLLELLQWKIRLLDTFWLYFSPQLPHHIHRELLNDVQIRSISRSNYFIFAGLRNSYLLKILLLSIFRNNICIPSTLFLHYNTDYWTNIVVATFYFSPQTVQLTWN